MNNKQLNNKTIAKNTLFLYFRMMFIMAVSLYTSRVVLQTLGVIDYGVYNVVGGIVALFGFVTGPMAGATQRYITFALGKGNLKRSNEIFSTCINIYIIASGILLLLCETLGVWFLFNRLQIPDTRLLTAFWVFQSSVISAIIILLTVPFNAEIIAHEKMSAFAFISIFEVIGKLGVVFLLKIICYDKLLLYAIMMLIIQSLTCLCYVIYCRSHFEESKYHFCWNKDLCKDIASFAGWSLFGNLAAVGYSQGLNILLNMFFGPIVNTARGVAVQVQSAVCQFVTNFQTAINPQITKSYAMGDMSYMLKLVEQSSRLSFYLIYILSFPVLVETDFILKLWLGNVPDYTIVFLRIILMTTWIASLANPLVVSVLATGKIQRYQQIVGCVLMSIVPFSYLFLKLGYPPQSVFGVHLVIEIIAHIIRLFILNRLIGISISSYFTNVVIKIFIVSILIIPLPLFVSYNMDEGFSRFLLVSITSMVSAFFSLLYYGLTRKESEFIMNKAKQVFYKQ